MRNPQGNTSCTTTVALTCVQRHRSLAQRKPFLDIVEKPGGKPTTVERLAALLELQHPREGRPRPFPLRTLERPPRLSQCRPDPRLHATIIAPQRNPGNRAKFDPNNADAEAP